LFRLAQVDLSVVGFRQKQFGSPGIKLRSAAFVRLDMGALVTDHSMEGLAKLGQPERVGPGAGEHKINIAIDFEYLPDAFAHRRGPFVLAVRGSIMCIRLLQSFPGLGTNRCRVVAGKLVTNGVGAHRASITRVLPPDNQHKRLPDSGALGLRICQANPFSILLLELRSAVSFSISESACQVTVFPSKFFHLIIAFRCILPNARRQTNLRQ